MEKELQKERNIRFLLGTAGNTPTYKTIILYPDANGGKCKVNEYNEPLPFEALTPKGCLLVDVCTEEGKDALISIFKMLNDDSVYEWHPETELYTE